MCPMAVVAPLKHGLCLKLALYLGCGCHLEVNECLVGSDQICSFVTWLQRSKHNTHMDTPIDLVQWYECVEGIVMTLSQTFCCGSR